jgi:hypothetical protein
LRPSQNELAKEDASMSKQAANVLERYADWYSASDEPEEVTFGPVRGLSVSGQGEPGGTAYMKALNPLLAVAKATLNIAAEMNSPFTMPPLEGLWWVEDNRAWSDVPRAEWCWHLFVRLPDSLSAEVADRAREAVRIGEGMLSAGRVQLVMFTESRSVQVLHHGHYADEPRTLERMNELIERKQLVPNGLHHEIYLSDVRETDPSKMQTILRQPVRPR